MITHYKNIKQLISLKSAHQKDGRFLKPEDLSLLSNASILFDNDKILWVGLSSDIPSSFKISKTYNLDSYIITPELVDSHTHLLFGGNRSSEYIMRLNGDSYQSIASSGGGIIATQRATNQMNIDDLFEICCKRIETINQYGIGTIEIKSGYGLDYDKEYEYSHLIDRLKKHFKPSIQIFNTFMAAHAIPKNFSSSMQYITQVVLPLLEKLANENIIDAVDIFQEEGYFTYQDAEVLFDLAQKLKIPVKSHADEFINTQACELACTYDALSADHLLAISANGIDNIAKSKTVATLLPGTAFFLGKPQANARELLDHGAKVAIASDYNPGSSHLDNLLLVACMAAPTYRMNIAELWASITLNASHALGYTNQGSVTVGAKPRFSYFKCNDHSEIIYNWNKNFAVSIKELQAS
jgi:imidazolonepropionase